MGVSQSLFVGEEVKYSSMNRRKCCMLFIILHSFVSNKALARVVVRHPNQPPPGWEKHFRHWRHRPPPPSNIPKIHGRSFSTKHDQNTDWMQYLKPPYMKYDQKKVQDTIRMIRVITSSPISAPGASITMKIRPGPSQIKTTPGCPSLALTEINTRALSLDPVTNSQDCQEDYLCQDHRSIIVLLLHSDIVSKFRPELASQSSQQVTIKEKCEEN